jgi:diguanylate cyclase (GGDEF)-like protein
MTDAGSRTASLALVVDDDLLLRLLAREALEQAGLLVEEAENGEQALDAFDRLRPDIVLMDVMMPVMDGFTACAALRKRPHGDRVPVLIMTGLDDVESINRAYDAGATDFVTKPIIPLILSHRVRYVLRASRAAEEIRNNEAQIHHLAFYDSLTHLPNRRLYTDRLNQALASAKRHTRTVATLFLDLDRFKRVNDTLGHNVGDKLLRSVADRLLSCLRQTDYVARPEGDDDTPLVARIGGDEFFILLTEMAHAEDAAKVAGRVLQTLSQPFTLEGHEIRITPSIGIAVYPADGADVDMLLKNADTALYHAKDQGRNNYQFYTQSMNATALKRLTLEGYLSKALEREELRVYYQPQVNILSGRIVGMEALVRWQHPELGLVSPVEFIPLAEESGLIIPIGEWVLRTACTQNAAWQAEGFAPLRLSVNLSGKQFQEKNLAETVEKALLASGMAPQCLELELTESMLMQKVDATIKTLHELKGLGLRLSIDDFGTGYSSLSYLKRFPIDTLKVDQSFVRDLTTDPDSAALTSAIIAMAHGLKLSVIAEGVETPEHLAFLKDHHCEEAQGYLFSKPIPAEAFTRYLEERMPREPIAAAQVH